MFSRFFIYRPIFSAVISISIVIAGLVALLTLPVAQYPALSPPTVEVKATFPGANAMVVAETVATPIEQEVNGVENMIYMKGLCANNGTYTLTITFEIGTDLDIAAVQVQNRVSSATSKLPPEVTQQGVTIKKKSNDIVLLISLVSPEGTYDDLFLNNYGVLRIKDELARLNGVGDLTVFGVGEYSMRIWLDPDRLKARGLTTNDVVNAIKEQNVQVAAGQIGQPPAPAGQSFQYTVSTLGRLESVEQFEEIIIKRGEDGALLRVKDVARVELGSQTYDMSSQYNGKQAASLAIYQLPGSNALEVSAAVRAKMDELSAVFPEDMEYIVALDTTEFVKVSIREVINTLFIAIVLVIAIIYLFIQDWRATLIPAATIPVSLIGTFMVMSGMGISINTISLFGIVLAIGIVVDDAIVVVENTQRNIDETGMNAKDATVKAMEEVTGPVIATTLVLLAVFIPTSFLGGITGLLYREFALTIATATVFSSINALTLSPALCGLLLRPTPKKRNVIFRGFNWAFDRTTSAYDATVKGLLRVSLLVLLVLGGVTAFSGWGFTKLPTGFVPSEDLGYIYVVAQLPDAASFERTLGVVKQVNQIMERTPGIANYTSIPGYSLLDAGAASNAAAFFVKLDHWDDRKTPELSVEAIIRNLFGQFSSIQEGIVLAFNPPVIPGVGTTGGMEMMLQDRGGVGLEMLQVISGDIVQDAPQQPTVSTASSTFRANFPQVFVDIDRTKAKTLGVPLSVIFSTLQAYLGSAYVNDFNTLGRAFQVRIQAEAGYRAKIEDILSLEVRSEQGYMIPLSTLVTIKDTLGPPLITRYNLYPSALINASPPPGISTGQAMSTMEQLNASSLPDTMGYEWTGMSYQQKAAGGEAPLIFALALLFVYLVLSAQYESWLISAAVVLSVPYAIFGAVATLMALSMENNVYTQIGMVLLIALASKNAILIVEFAKQMRSEGKSTFDAARDAAVQRFRPVLMTAFSFILGTLPLVVATGAGAASRRYLGITVFGGMIVGTILIVIFTPSLYAIVQRLRELGGVNPESSQSPPEETDPPEAPAIPVPSTTS
ncbi:MAG: multidrug efflux RND transporter permease subunit [Planctomycetota bacterium]|nr:multidrug efflux RND transporter permease subunit [Planctomycetota bacterium]